MWSSSATTEVERQDSLHHLVILPVFEVCFDRASQHGGRSTSCSFGRKDNVRIVQLHCLQRLLRRRLSRATCWRRLWRRRLLRATGWRRIQQRGWWWRWWRQVLHLSHTECTIHCSFSHCVVSICALAFFLVLGRLGPFRSTDLQLIVLEDCA